MYLGYIQGDTVISELPCEMLEYTNSAFQASARACLAGVGTHAHRSSCASTNRLADPKEVDPFFHFIRNPKKNRPSRLECAFEHE